MVKLNTFFCFVINFFEKSVDKCVFVIYNTLCQVILLYKKGKWYMDLENNNRIVWIPYEDCIGFTKREEFEEEQIKIFNNLSEYMKCFFGKHTHVIEDEE